MMRWFGFLLLVLAFASGAFAAGLVVPPGGIALGEVQPGEAVAAEVVVSNDAERAIAVSRVKACCGGDAELMPMSVPAKGEAKLTLRMKAQIPGEIAKAVTLYCDDPYQPIVEIPVTGRVVETAVNYCDHNPPHFHVIKGKKTIAFPLCQVHLVK